MKVDKNNSHIVRMSMKMEIWKVLAFILEVLEKKTQLWLTKARTHVFMKNEYILLMYNYLLCDL